MAPKDILYIYILYILYTYILYIVYENIYYTQSNNENSDILIRIIIIIIHSRHLSVVSAAGQL